MDRTEDIKELIEAVIVAEKARNAADLAKRNCDNAYSKLESLKKSRSWGVGRNIPERFILVNNVLWKIQYSENNPIHISPIELEHVS